MILGNATKLEVQDLCDIEQLSIQPPLSIIIIILAKGSTSPRNQLPTIPSLHVFFPQRLPFLSQGRYFFQIDDAKHPVEPVTTTAYGGQVHIFHKFISGLWPTKENLDQEGENTMIIRLE